MILPFIRYYRQVFSTFILFSFSAWGGMFISRQKQTIRTNIWPHASSSLTCADALRPNSNSLHFVLIAGDQWIWAPCFFEPWPCFFDPWPVFLTPSPLFFWPLALFFWPLVTLFFWPLGLCFWPLTLFFWPLTLLFWPLLSRTLKSIRPPKGGIVAPFAGTYSALRGYIAPFLVHSALCGYIAPFAGT